MFVAYSWIGKLRLRNLLHTSMYVYILSYILRCVLGWYVCKFIRWCSHEKQAKYHITSGLFGRWTMCRCARFECVLRKNNTPNISATTQLFASNYTHTHTRIARVNIARKRVRGIYCCLALHHAQFVCAQRERARTRFLFACLWFGCVWHTWMCGQVSADKMLKHAGRRAQDPERCQ